MAKWGQGDPRWIVEERADATNVNNWHWSVIGVPWDSNKQFDCLFDKKINISKKKGEGDVLKDLMRTEGTTKVREALRDYLKALKTEFTLGMILPTKATVGQEPAAEQKPSGNTVQVCWL
ncbi:hypothetical protein llap_9357 [Limosa lapponica baueri]|uniref:Uncharacterized protein n=1 Tax=Limosa lapponica baueri TaxID=1758121 RepID=A0A2I0U2N5_LIMLA|nr:hypothetical protein llap_9357 [Limosa lapponica baueri]